VVCCKKMDGTHQPITQPTGTAREGFVAEAGFCHAKKLSPHISMDFCIQKARFELIFKSQSVGQIVEELETNIVLIKYIFKYNEAGSYKVREHRLKGSCMLKGKFYHHLP